MKAPPCEAANTLAQLPAYLLSAELSRTAGTAGSAAGIHRDTPREPQPAPPQGYSSSQAAVSCRIPSPFPLPSALESVCSVHLEPTEGIVENSQRIPVPAGEWVGWAMG